MAPGLQSTVGAAELRELGAMVGLYGMYGRAGPSLWDPLGASGLL